MAGRNWELSLMLKSPIYMENMTTFRTCEATDSNGKQGNTED